MYAPFSIELSYVILASFGTVTKPNSCVYVENQQLSCE